jgi:hypothetical protein
MEREITDSNGIIWISIQAYSGIFHNAENQDVAQVKGQEDSYWVVCTSSGGGKVGADQAWGQMGNVRLWRDVAQRNWSPAGGMTTATASGLDSTLNRDRVCCT